MDATSEYPGPVFLVTGGCGFIGSHVVAELLARFETATVVSLDIGTYAAVRNARFGGLCTDGEAVVVESNRERKARYGPSQIFFRDGRTHSDCGQQRHVLYSVDVAEYAKVAEIFATHRPDFVLHLAAESHVDRSLDAGSSLFTRTNVLGTHVLLDAALEEYQRRVAGDRPRDLPAGGFRFLYCSTDEVMGPYLTKEGFGYGEDARLRPCNPYAASKAAGELLVYSYSRSFGLPAIVTRGANTYGPWQHPEKFLPTIVYSALANKMVPIYGDGLQQREWLHVEDHAAALVWLLHYGWVDGTYNLGSGDRPTNLALAQRVLQLLDKPSYRIQHVPDRPGHDRRYRLDSCLIRSLGWRPRHCLDDALSAVVQWYASPVGRAWAVTANQAAEGRLGLGRSLDASKAVTT